MSDKQTPKAFKDFLISLNMGIDESFDMSEINQAPELSVAFMFWNAATKATRTEYDDKIKAMQAEIDKRNMRIKELKRDRVNRLFKYRDTLKELNQRGEDE